MQTFLLCVCVFVPRIDLYIHILAECHAASFCSGAIFWRQFIVIDIIILVYMKFFSVVSLLFHISNIQPLLRFMTKTLCCFLLFLVNSLAMAFHENLCLTFLVFGFQCLCISFSKVKTFDRGKKKRHRHSKLEWMFNHIVVIYFDSIRWKMKMTDEKCRVSRPT